MNTLDAIREALSKATPGPWRAERRVACHCLAFKPWHGHDGHPTYATYLVRGRFTDQMYGDDWKHCDRTGTHHSGPDSDYVQADARLCAFLRNAAPALLAVAEAAQGMRSAWEAFRLQEGWGVEPRAEAALEAMHDANEALDTALSALAAGEAGGTPK